MKRKTLRKRVSKKSRKTRNKKMSKPRNVRKTKTKNMRKRKTRINKKHYSRKMRGGGYYLGEYISKSSDYINYYLVIEEKNVILRWSSDNTDKLDKEINNIYDSDRKVFSHEYNEHISANHETSVAGNLNSKILEILRQINLI